MLIKIMLIKKLLLILLKIQLINSYILPQIVKEYHTIGIYKEINKEKPYIYNLGKLPLLLWFNNNKPITIINSCKHLGNNLKKSKIENNCLVCPYHKSVYNESDKLGNTIVNDGLVWWNYKSKENKLPKIPIINKNKEYETINFKLEIKTNFINTLLNLLYISKEENSNIEYKNKEKEMIIKNINYNNDKIVKKYFIYPYTIIIMNKYKKINKYINFVYMLNIIPLEDNKNNVYITIKYEKGLLNYIYNSIYSIYLKIYINLLKIKLEEANNNFNYDIILKDNKEKYIDKIYKMYKNYMYLDEYTIHNFIINRKFY